MRLLAVVLLVFTGFSLAAPGPKQPPKSAPLIVGEWRLQIANGEKPVGTTFETFRADGAWIVRVRNGDKEDENQARYEIDVKADPPKIDLVCDPRDPQQTLKGICKIEGDTLTICFQTRSAAERPKEFKEVRNEISLFVYERVKAKDK